MKNLYENASVEEIKGRLALIRADSPRQWGLMNPGQMLAHCALGMEWAVGDRVPLPAPFFLRAIGRFVKPFALGNETPMKKNVPTARELVIPDDRDIDAERARLIVLIDRFAAAGSAGCTKCGHPFFGKLTAEEWAVLTYKHLDHHLRQFGL